MRDLRYAANSCGVNSGASADGNCKLSQAQAPAPSERTRQGSFNQNRLWIPIKVVLKTKIFRQRRSVWSLTAGFFSHQLQRCR